MIHDARERRSNKNDKFMCDQCDYQSKSKILLNRHIQTAHKQHQLKCSKCD